MKDRIWDVTWGFGHKHVVADSLEKALEKFKEWASNNENEEIIIHSIALLEGSEIIR